MKEKNIIQRDLISLWNLFKPILKWLFKILLQAILLILVVLLAHSILFGSQITRYYISLTILGIYATYILIWLTIRTEEKFR